MALGKDFIALFEQFTEGAFSPQSFKLWTGIFLVGAALERRVWIRTGNRRTYPNLYVWLVAPPGVGKQVIDDGKELFRRLETDKSLHKLFIAPDSMTRASIVDDLAKAKQVYLPLAGPPVEYHSMTIFAEEMGVLMPGYDGDFLGKLNKLFNNPPDHIETRRHGPVRELRISNPQLSFLAGTQPGWMTEVLPETAWSTGLTSRTIMVYASQTPFRDLFTEFDEDPGLATNLVERLRQLTRLYGECELSPEATQRLLEWHRAGGPPAPRHSKLEHYLRRRTNLHVIKLSIIAGVSRTGRLRVELEDCDRAIEWLVEAEKVMPDIFRAMVGRSDAQVIEELHYYLTALWRAGKMKPVPEEKLFHFLHQRVPSEKVEKILAIAERSNVIARLAGEALYIPRAKQEFDIE
jgi:hypothetical protein